jgi:hypothetical protein
VLLFAAESGETEGFAFFDTGKNADEASFDLIALDDVLSDFFLGGVGRRNVLIRTPLGLCESFGMISNALGEFDCVGAEIPHKNALTADPQLDSFTTADRTERTSEENAVESGYNTFDAVLVPLQKTLHGLAPL